MDLTMFRKVVLEPNRGSGQRGTKAISLDEKSNTFSFSTALTDCGKIKPGDRYDLYNCGNTYMLKPFEAGIIKVRKSGGTDRYLAFTNFSMMVEIKNRTRFRKFKAWVEEGCIFFKIDEEVK